MFYGDTFRGLQLTSTRAVVDHVVPGDPAEQVRIHVMDEPGAGGANHKYVLSWKQGDDAIQNLKASAYLVFQDGPIKEVGVNGVTQEALLAIVIDRLRSFQAGPFASPLNERALSHCKIALDALHERTRDRIARGVEGMSKV